ncbi:MAG TPA: hypothetical protein VNJ54_12690 [Plantibacter sp.]|uniref:hypothetical protein n=1 Tax=Plantibacter sp. TaxID=1871045 RepID=UPI002B8A6810|nr:hypothetical protein [Plantibacter sp.]
MSGARWKQQLADAEWRHEQADNWATEGAVETARAALAGDVEAQQWLDTNPQWQVPGSPLFTEFLPLAAPAEEPRT